VKKYLPYTLGALAVIVLLLLLVGAAGTRKRILNERITLKQADKIPYGFFAARNLLPSLFKEAQVMSDKRPPGGWDSISASGTNQAVFLVGDLHANESELGELSAFAERGNHVFLICRTLSFDARRFFGFDHDDVSADEDQDGVSRDSLQLTLAGPRFDDTNTYVYPGRKFSNSFDSLYLEKMVVLGRNGNGSANFLQMKIGKGYIYLHTAPLAFSNYFILHKDNVHYFEQAVSVVPAGVRKVLWNEYYLFKKVKPKEKEPNILSVLFRYEAFRWAFLTALVTLLLLLLSEMRRKQRIIPIVQRPKNESLDFVRTIGRLYYGQKDHNDLALKMAAGFLDHVRTRYKLSTENLDEGFIQALHHKSGYPHAGIARLVQYIGVAGTDTPIAEKELSHFYQSLEGFYQQT
jgi:hypothetical protein